MEEKMIPTIELGGRFWFLKVTHRVLERFSAIARCSLQDFDAVLLRYDMMVLLLWLMMAESRPDLTRDKLQVWLNALPVFEAVELVSKSVGEAVEYSFPKPEKDADKEPVKADPENPTDADI